MYVDLTKEEILERKQYWYSKYCNSIFREHKVLFFNLYCAYSDLLIQINQNNVQAKEQNNVS